MVSTVLRETWRRKALLSLAGTFVILASLALSVSLVAAQASDFAVSSNPGGMCVNPGIDARSVISVASVDGFAGTVNLYADVSPSTGVTLSQIPSTVTLASGQTVTFNLDMYTTTSTPLYVYTVTITAFVGADVHQTTVALTVSSGCSVGGTIVPTSPASSGPSLMLLVLVAGLAGVAAVGPVVYSSRHRNL